MKINITLPYHKDTLISLLKEKSQYFEHKIGRLVPSAFDHNNKIRNTEKKGYYCIHVNGQLEIFVSTFSPVINDSDFINLRDRSPKLLLKITELTNQTILTGKLRFDIYAFVHWAIDLIIYAIIIPISFLIFNDIIFTSSDNRLYINLFFILFFSVFLFTFIIQFRRNKYKKKKLLELINDLKNTIN